MGTFQDVVSVEMIDASIQLDGGGDAYRIFVPVFGYFKSGHTEFVMMFDTVAQVEVWVVAAGDSVVE